MKTCQSPLLGATVWATDHPRNYNKRESCDETGCVTPRQIKSECKMTRHGRRIEGLCRPGDPDTVVNGDPGTSVHTQKAVK